ncbi:MAG: tetratricopeptide repeat protein [Mucinivorans sp.]
MKKLLIALLSLGTLTAVAQTPKELEALTKKLAKNTELTQDAKKSSTVGVWVDRANILVDISKAYTSKLIVGFTVDQITPIVGAPENTEEQTISGVTYTKYSYQNFDFWVDANGSLMFWKVKTELVPGALDKAYESLVKAKAINAKEFTSKAVIATSNLANEFQTKAMAFYSLQEYEPAAKAFNGAAMTSELTGDIDTTMIYYSAIASFDGGKYEEALPKFEKTLSLGYEQDGMLYYYVGECQNKQGKVKEAIETFEKGFEKYPQSAAIVGTLINLYLGSDGDPKKLVSLIEQAQTLDPANTSLYLVESTIYDKLGDSEKAYHALDKAITADSTYFNAYYNYGIYKVMEADKKRVEAEKLDLNDVKGYNALLDQAIAFQAEAIVKLEKAFELAPESPTVIDLLRQLYFPKRDESPEMMAKYNKFLELSKTVSEQK